MKVLFAVSNEEISESIVKKYQKEYKQIISYKNVYYFNAILKELQKDKGYDRIVISEDLEAFTHTQYDQIDKFIFEKLDSISDEASNTKGRDIPIILICSDRRAKAEEMLIKIFGIGIYNAIIGADRSVDEVCRLINRPRLKKEAKAYYNIESENVTYQSENENDVSEMEIQNILAHYKRLGKNEDKYVESFENIAAQYNDVQLRIISKFLPLNVRAVLEEKSQKYQQVMSFHNTVSDTLRKTKEQQKGTSEKLLKPMNITRIRPEAVVIPSGVDLSKTTKLGRQTEVPMVEPIIEEPEESSDMLPGFEDESNNIQKNDIEPIAVEPKPKRGRGRPRKTPLPEEGIEQKPKRGRGRPRKTPLPDELDRELLSEIDGDDQQEDNLILPGFDDIENEQEISSVSQGIENENQSNILPGFDNEPEETDTTLPGFDNESEEISTTLPGFDDENEEASILPGFNNEPEQTISQTTNNSGILRNGIGNNQYTQQTYMREESNERIDLSYLLKSDKKIVTFVGTSKNGTSFIVNNLAELLSTSGINVAILDTTRNKNSYYIYTNNEEELREIATHSIYDLAHGEASGITVNKNLTVYTSLPDDDNEIGNVDKILETLLQNHTLILIDTDFETPYRYFEQSQETYLVQSWDILTIQPLTAFLRNLKGKGILNEKKLRIVLNKTVKIRGISEKNIIGGMAYYNDPAMSYMTELFDRTLIKYMELPFEEETYAKYLEGIIECNINLKGYSKLFMQKIKELANMVYPLTNNYMPPSSKKVGRGQNAFTPNMNSTLNQMKNNY